MSGGATTPVSASVASAGSQPPSAMSAAQFERGVPSQASSSAASSDAPPASSTSSDLSSAASAIKLTDDAASACSDRDRTASFGLPSQVIAIPDASIPPVTVQTDTTPSPSPKVPVTPTIATRSRSASVGLLSSAAPAEPQSSVTPSAVSSSPSVSAQIKTRLRAGTWKGTSNRPHSYTSTYERERPSTARSSVYGAFPDPDGQHMSASFPSYAMASQPHLAIPPSPEAPVPVSRRRLFGRSNSVRNLGKGVIPEHAKEPGGGILRRIGSRTFFGSKDAMRSTDTLGSSSDASQSVKASESGKLGSLGGWSRKLGRGGQRGESDSAHSPGPTEFGASPSPNHLADPSTASRASVDSNRSIRSLGSIHRSGKAQVGENATDQQGAAALPKRLSGWILNMVGNESASHLPTSSEAPTLSPVKEREGRTSSASFDQSLSEPKRQTSGDLPSSRRDASPDVSSSQPGVGIAGAARSKAGSLISSLSGRSNGKQGLQSAHAGVGSAGAASNSSSSTGSSVWPTGGLGFDRALKFFLDSDSDDKSQEGMWLLGVWHGPPTSTETESLKAELAGEQSVSYSEKGRDTRLRSEGTATDEMGTEVVINPVRRSGSVRFGEETPRTPTSLASSLPPSSPGADCEDGYVLARNPPTPRTSPVKARQEKLQSFPGSANKSLASSSTAASERSSSPTPASSAGGTSSRQPVPDWQMAFQFDFSSRIWCTYRSQFAPIARDGTISDEAAAAAANLAAQQEAASSAECQSPSDKASQAQAASGRQWIGRKGQESSTQPSLANSLGAGSPNSNPGLSLGDKMGITHLWGRATAVAQAAGFSRAGLTTDAGWGCMLRTGQSLLANALLDVHLGRDWCRRSPPAPQAVMLAPHAMVDEASPAGSGGSVGVEEWRQARLQYAKYVQLLSWFLDDPSPACPFGVHRMAREGKRLGKEVGEWFGPSTAAGAIKQLVKEFPDAGIGVSVASDGVVYLDEVRAAAINRSPTGTAPSRRRASGVWQRPVLILIGIRLGLEGVNPMYYDSVKATFSFPQSVGIAGGRPSSSYYFMGHQGNSLFYLDPHHVRPAVPLRHPPSRYPPAVVPDGDDGDAVPTSSPQDDELEWWSHAYSEAQIATFHCDRVRRMPIKSLDPSMLLGFLCKDEAALADLCSRVKAMPKTIFSFADTAPRWSEDDEFDPSMESFSESSVGDANESERGDDDDEEDNEDERHHSGWREAKLTDIPRNHQENVPQTRSDKLGYGQLATSHRQAPVERILFPSADRTAGADQSAIVRQPLASDMRHPSTSSNVTARAHSRQRIVASPSLAADESFSTLNFSDSEAGSAWEEVSEVGTVAGQSAATSAAPSSSAIYLSQDPVVEKLSSMSPETTEQRSPSPDMVDVSLDTPVEECANPVNFSPVHAPMANLPRRHKQPKPQAPRPPPPGLDDSEDDF